VVEVIWTIVPFVIVILMALPATKVVVALKDTTNADLTVKVTGMQWKWGYDYIKGEGEGIGFVSTLDSTQRAMSNNGGPKANEVVDDYLLKVDNPLVVPVDNHRRRRDPFFRRACFWHQARCDSRLCSRHLVQGGKGRYLLWPMRRALR
jgi:hypothetical protein